MLSYQLILMSWGLVHLQLYVLFYREWSHYGGLLHMVFAFSLLTGPVSALVCAPESAVLWPWLPRSLPSPPSPWRVALPLNSIYVLPSLLGWHVPLRGPCGSPPSCLSVSSVWASALLTTASMCLLGPLILTSLFHHCRAIGARVLSILLLWCPPRPSSAHSVWYR